MIEPDRMHFDILLHAIAISKNAMTLKIIKRPSIWNQNWKKVYPSTPRMRWEHLIHIHTS